MHRSLWPVGFGLVTVVIGLTGVCSQTTAAEQAAASGKPNFIIIMADDMGYGDLSCYGNKKFKTPHLDRMAAEGTKFLDFHSSGPVCSPTRAGLLTGRYQQRAGVPGVIFADPKQNRHHGLQTSETTFAELLGGAGYATGVFGKWHLGYNKKFNPLHHGFDTFRGYVSGNIDYISHYDRMEVYDWWDGLKMIEEPGYSTHLITKHAVKFIRDNKERPFCLYVAHESPHSPFQGPNDPPQRGPNADKSKQGPVVVQRAYREMIQELDRGVGDVLAAVKACGIEKKTLVFFFSDNGATPVGSCGNLRGHKGSVWEGGHRVPAIAWHPGAIKPGGKNGLPMISIDLTPTMLSLAGVKPPAGHKFDGVDLSPTIYKYEQLPKRKIYWDYNGASAVRDGDWKLVVNTRGSARAKKKTKKDIVPQVGLFNLRSDTGERRNLAEKQPERVAKMQAALAAWKKDVAQGATLQPDK